MRNEPRRTHEDAEDEAESKRSRLKLRTTTRAVVTVSLLVWSGGVYEAML